MAHNPGIYKSLTLRKKDPRVHRPALKQISSSRNNNNYVWYDPDDSLGSKQSKADRRREELLEILSDKNSPPAEKQKRVNEWIALVKERDRLLRTKVEQENTVAQRGYIKDLNHLLHQLPSFSNSSSDQQLLNSLLRFRSQLEQYCVSTDVCSPPRRSNSVPTLASASYAIPPAPAPPPPSFKPPSLEPPPRIPAGTPTKFLLYQDNATGSQPARPSDLLCTATHSSRASSPEARDETDRGPSALPVFQRKPLQATGSYRSLMQEIQAHSRDKLRRTSLAHTPGGTPDRSHVLQNCSGNTHGEFIRKALLKKFKNIRFHSTPKKQNRSSSSFMRRRSRGASIISNHSSIECSSVWSEGGYASDPDLSTDQCSLYQSSPRSAANMMESGSCVASPLVTDPGVDQVEDIESSFTTSI